jgi:hypothetical protein
MPNIDASVDPHSDLAVSMSKSMMRSENQMRSFNVDANFTRPPDYFIYIFNVSPKTFVVERPPLMPRVQIPGVESGQRYRLACKLPNILNQTWQDADTAQPRVHGFHGEQVAGDIINSANLTGDQWKDIENQLGQGVDLSKWGVFWSLKEKPTEEELSKAKARLEKNYRALLQEADDFARAGQYARIMPDHHLAASHFKYRAAWNAQVEVPETCPACGGGMKKGSVVHGGVDGCGAVLDWEKAVEYGQKSKADVPESKRWWKEPVAKVI